LPLGAFERPGAPSVQAVRKLWTRIESQLSKNG
jgi:hypothetical protein